MSRQAIADARAFIEAAWNEEGGAAHRALLHNALDRICDAVESLDRDEGPRLPLSADEWELVVSDQGTPDPRSGWHAVAPLGCVSDDTLLAFGVRILWARKREGAK